MRKSLLVGLLLALVGGLQGAAAARPPATASDSIALLLAQAHAQTGSNLPQARWLATRALRLARRTAQPREMSECLYWMGIVEQFAGNDLAAQRYLEQSLALARQAGWAKGQADIYLGLGLVCFNQNDFRGALRFYRLADQAYASLPAEAGSEFVRLTQRLKMRINISSVYLELQLPDSAGRICRQALALPGAAQHPAQLNGLLQNLGEVQLAAQHPDSARRSWAQGLRLARNTTDSTGLYSRLAVADLALHQPLAARQWALRALALSRRSGVVEDRGDALETLADALHALRRPEAFDTLKRYLALHDTLLASVHTDEITQAQARFHASEQQAQIRALEQDRLLVAQARELARLRARQQLAGAALVLLLVLAGAGWLLWQYRRRQAAAAAALRNQLAADLHDDVGTLLSQISMQSGVLQAGLADAAGQQQQLGQIAQASQLAVRQLNDVVWSLDTHNDTLPNLLDRLRDYAYEVLAPAGFAVDFDLPATLPDQALPTELRRNLYLIYKEALHNILKHAAGATSVRVRLAREAAPPALLLSVANDAPRPVVAAAAAAAPGRRSGHGLRNMAARAAALGGSASSGPEPGGGFAVRLRLPLPQ